jgi:hypothetical protein
MVTIERELVKQIQRLDGEQQKQVLDFVYSLTHPRGELVRDFLERTKAIRIPEADLEEMKQFIEEEFERIDWDDWNNPPALSA